MRQLPLVSVSAETFRDGGASARFSTDGKHRLDLTRTWGDGKRVAFVMLNPSIANEERLDPTLRKCMGFAKRWDFGGMVIGNLYTLVSTYPEQVPKHSEPNHPDADEALLEIAVAVDKIVVAWGTQPWLAARAHEVTKLLAGFKPLWCLGTTQDGWPRHPLYRSYEADLQLFRAKGGPFA